MNLGLETETLEHKKTTAETKAGVVSLCAMLNKHGHGTVYFGVRNDGEVMGQQIGESTMRDVSQAVAVGIKPQVIPTISLELLDDCNVVKLIATGTNKPYSAYGKYYMRSADEDRELSPAQLKELMLSAADADEISSRRASRQDLSFSQLEMLFAAKGLTTGPNFERNAGLLCEDGSYNMMAALLSDANDTSIKVVTFAGTDKSEMVRRNEYGGKCLIVSMDQAVSYVESLNETRVALGAHQRDEERLFDIECFTEAWQNACAHNRWSTLNPPAVYLFSDRIEVVSTGGLPASLSEDEFFRGISHPVNRGLQKALGQLGYVEQTGHGVPKIVATYGKRAFDITDNHICVTIPFNWTRIATSGWGNLDLQLNEAQQRIYDYFAASPQSTISDTVAATGLSDGYVRKIIGQLKKRGLLIRVGSNKTGYWQVR